MCCVGCRVFATNQFSRGPTNYVDKLIDITQGTIRCSYERIKSILLPRVSIFSSLHKPFTCWGTLTYIPTTFKYRR